MEESIRWVLDTIDHPIHFVTEIILAILLIYLYYSKSYGPRPDASLSKTEEEELINDWAPEPLISKADLEAANSHPSVPVVEGPYGPHVQIGGEDFLNFSSNGFLGYHIHPKIIDVAIETTNHYGVGACGPRGFYGSFDTHLELEKNIAKFMGTEDCVIFSSEFQTIASVIPSFAKPGDYLICDKGLSFAIQNGILLSRSTVKWFDHNNMDDLNKVLQSLGEVFRKQKNRVFLVVESIYSNYGDLLDLKKVLQLKEKYPFRIILEESYSIGVLGATGRGLTEFIGVPATKVDIITGSIGNALGSVGGFAVGTVAIANHMRLNCSGYVFSCSSPPFITKTCTTALELLTTGQEIKQLQQNIQKLHQGLSSGNITKNLTTSSSPESPLVVLRLSESARIDKTQDEVNIQRIIEELFKRKIVVRRAKYSKREVFVGSQEPHFYVSVSAMHSTGDIENFIEELNHVISKI